MTRLPFDGAFRITQGFGNEHPRYSALGLAGHNGVDFATPDALPILAPADGECVEVGHDAAGYGNYVKLRTPGGEDWLLAHLHLWHLPRPGTWCPEGSQIGFADNTGMSTGVHLHVGYRARFWVRGWPYNGYDDPLPVLTGG
jgi:murein DD-endopeptidase